MYNKPYYIDQILKSVPRPLAGETTVRGIVVWNMVSHQRQVDGVKYGRLK